MKKIVFLVSLLALGVTLIYAGAKRVDDFIGTKTVSLEDSATTTSNTTSIVEVLNLVNATTDQKYDQIDGIIYIPDMVGSDTALGNTDTAIVKWKFAFGPYTVVAETDTGLPPCTLTFNYREYIVNTATILGDSTAVKYAQSTRPYLYYDKFWIEMNFEDSALGADSTGTITPQYWIRATEDK